MHPLGGPSRPARRALLRTVLIFLAGMGIGAGAGAQYARYAAGAEPPASRREAFSSVEGARTYIHPLLAVSTPEATAYGGFVDLKRTLGNLVREQTRAGTLFRGALYFRDLESSRWIGVNENDTYYPASLLKVPVMIASYKESEKRPSALLGDVVYNPSVIPPIPFDAPSLLEPGRTYAVRDLIARMIVDSDNGATFALLDRLNPEFLQSVYAALGIPDPGDDSARYQISAKTYAFFFRILYNATYLSAEHSEEALGLLGRASFAEGLAAGVPAGTTVAHKFGEHVLAEGETITGVELSDCGIVYYPNHPYLLCAMAAAPTLQNAEQFIAGASRIAYDAMHAEYPNR